MDSLPTLLVGGGNGLASVKGNITHGKSKTQHFCIDFNRKDGDCSWRFVGLPEGI